MPNEARVHCNFDDSHVEMKPSETIKHFRVKFNFLDKSCVLILYKVSRMTTCHFLCFARLEDVAATDSAY